MCSQFDIILAMTDEQRQAILIRAPAELKQRLTSLAAELGVSVNAAVLVLLDEALRERGR